MFQAFHEVEYHAVSILRAFLKRPHPKRINTRGRRGLVVRLVAGSDVVKDNNNEIPIETAAFDRRCLKRDIALGK